MRIRVAGLSAVTALCAALLTGCGSGTNITEGPGLEGAYTGTFVAVLTLGTETGTMLTTVGPDGRFAGTLHNDTTDTDGSVTGTIEGNGHCSMTIVYPGETLTANGTVSADSRGHVVGVLTQYSQGGAAMGALSLDWTPDE